MIPSRPAVPKLLRGPSPFPEDGPLWRSVPLALAAAVERAAVTGCAGSMMISAPPGTLGAGKRAGPFLRNQRSFGAATLDAAGKRRVSRPRVPKAPLAGDRNFFGELAQSNWGCGCNSAESDGLDCQRVSDPASRPRSRSSIHRRFSHSEASFLVANLAA
jgi:hypothetical protein